MKKSAGRKIKNLVIDCNKWLRNRQGSGTYLLRSQDGKMCCLGFECRARGFAKKTISDETTPHQLASYIGRPICGMTKRDKKLSQTSTINECIRINDDTSITDKERMNKLTNVFKRRGIKLRFINIPEGQ